MKLSAIVASAAIVCGPIVRPAPVHAAEVAASPPVGIRVELADTVDDPELVTGWMHEAAVAGMAAADVSPEAIPAGRSLVIEIGGSLLAYEYTVGVRVGAAWHADLVSARCKCNDDLLVARVREAVTSVAPRLVGTTDATTPATPDSPPASVAARPPKLGTEGKAGVALLAVGGGAALGGVAVLALGRRPDGPTAANVERGRGRDFRAVGFAMLGTGLVVAIVGAVLLGRDRGRAKRAKVAVGADARGAGFMLTGRF